MLSNPKSVKDNARVTIERAKAYTPKRAGINILANIMVKSNPPILDIDKESKL